MRVGRLVASWVCALGVGALLAGLLVRGLRVEWVLRDWLAGCLVALLSNLVADLFDYLALRKGGVAGVQLGLAGTLLSLVLALVVTFFWMRASGNTGARVFVGGLLGFYLAFLARRVMLLIFGGGILDERRRQ